MLSVALATKFFAAPLLIGLASLAGKRWGPALSGLLGGLPLVGAPVVLVLWLTGGTEVAHRAALTAPIGVWATMTYLLVFATVSSKLGWKATLAVSWLCYLTVATFLHYSRLDQCWGLGLAVMPALFVVATRVLPVPATPPQAVHLPPQELFARMAAAVVLVALLTTAATVIGPDFTGVFAGAPVAATVIPSFTLALAGRDPLLRTLRGFLSGQMGFAAFFLVLAALMSTWGSVALIPATLVAVVVSALAAQAVERNR